jgi:hypothetical protein
MDTPLHELFDGMCVETDTRGRAPKRGRDDEECDRAPKRDRAPERDRDDEECDRAPVRDRAPERDRASPACSRKRTAEDYDVVPCLEETSPMKKHNHSKSVHFGQDEVREYVKEEEEGEGVTEDVPLEREDEEEEEGETMLVLRAPVVVRPSLFYHLMELVSVITPVRDPIVAPREVLFGSTTLVFSDPAVLARLQTIERDPEAAADMWNKAFMEGEIDGELHQLSMTLRRNLSNVRGGTIFYLQ